MKRPWRLLLTATLVLSACGGTDLTTSDGGGGRDGGGPSPDLTALVDAAPPAPDMVCVPDCNGKQCGDDGCGGSCGTCGQNQLCGDTGQCVNQCPCYYGACANCYCATAAEQYAVAHNCAIANYNGNEGALLSCTGSTTAPASWTVGTQCSNGCVVAPPMTPDYCAPPPGSGHKLWIAFDGGTATPRAATEAFFTCVFQHSNFDQLTAGFSTGRSFGGVGGVTVLGSSCATVHRWQCASVGDDSATLQCIENQAKWTGVQPDDIILYYPATATKNGSISCTNQSYTGGCWDGRNHWHIPVTLPNGSSVAVEAAFGFTGSGQNCQTALGLHEVYEAAAVSDGADCCNGQDGCAATPSPYGWYSETGCGQQWELQTVSPAGHLTQASYCTKLTFN